MIRSKMCLSTQCHTLSSKITHCHVLSRTAIISKQSYSREGMSLGGGPNQPEGLRGRVRGRVWTARGRVCVRPATGPRSTVPPRTLLPTVRLSVCPSVRPSICPSVRLSARLSASCLSIHPSIRPPVSPSVRPSVRFLSVHPSVHPSAGQSARLSASCLSIHPSVSPPVCPLPVSLIS